MDSFDEKSSTLLANTFEVQRLAEHTVAVRHNYTERETSPRSDQCIEYWTETRLWTMNSLDVVVHWSAISHDLSGMD